MGNPFACTWECRHCNEQGALAGDWGTQGELICDQRSPGSGQLPCNGAEDQAEEYLAPRVLWKCRLLYQGLQDTEEHILIGKCTCNMFKSITLPSGADRHQEINSRTLRERCNEYHRRNPSVQLLQVARQEVFPSASEAVAAPVAYRRAHMLLAYVTGALLSGLGCSIKIRGQVQARKPCATTDGARRALRVPCSSTSLRTAYGSIATTRAPLHSYKSRGSMCNGGVDEDSRLMRHARLVLQRGRSSISDIS